jgi:diguanylate cyclase (GGDEF)-like protein/PAS domain S-box-containing protein
MELSQDARQVLDLLQEGAYCVGRDGRILYWNAAATALTGYLPSQVLGHRCQDDLLIHVADGDGTLCHDECPMEATLRDGLVREGSVHLRRADESRCLVHIRIAPLVASSGEIVGAMQVFQPQDSGLTVLVRLQELERQAAVDSVTGVSTRRSLEETVRLRLDEMRDSGLPVGALMVDVDEFKLVNDRFGHTTGDGVLRAVAQTLVESVRPLDVVGRWGGDEFVVVAAPISHRGLVTVGHRLRKLVAGAELRVNGSVVPVTVSVGATLARATDGPHDLIDRADALMYESKRAGRNRVTVEGERPTG